MSRRNFVRRFKDATGNSPRDYRRREGGQPSADGPSRVAFFSDHSVITAPARYRVPHQTGANWGALSVKK